MQNSNSTHWKSALFGLIILCLNSNLIAQQTYESPYQLDWKKETWLMSGGLLGTAGSIILGLEMDPLTSDAIANLDRNQIWAIDRRATRYWSPDADLASDWARYVAWSLPVVVLFDKKMRKDFWATAFIGTEAILLTGALTGLTKVAARRERPFVYNPNAPFEEKNTRSARLSFFSGHTSTVAVFSFVSAKMYLDHHPNSQLRPLIWTGAVVLPALTGYFRYRAGKHFPTDVFMGYAVGAGLGLLIPEMHKKKNRDQGFYLRPGGGNGVSMGWRFK